MGHGAMTTMTKWRKTGIGVMFAVVMDDGPASLRGSPVDGPWSRRASSKLRGGKDKLAAPTLV
jgi:hypothetical protein